jgi:beta-lactamase class A
MMSDISRLFDYFADKAQSFSGHYGLAAQRIEADTAILFHANDIFPTASVIKLAVVAEYLAQVDAGTLTPDQPVVVQTGDQVGGSGVLKDLQPGLCLTLHDIATLAISISDNTAANLLIEQVGGLSHINARLQDLGMLNTRMGRPFIFDSAADNIGTPADFLTLLLKVARQQLISPTASQRMLDLMRRQQYLHYIPRYLPFHPFATEYGLPQTITIANKVGMLRGTVNDAAIIDAEGISYALVIFSRDCQDDRPDSDNEAAELAAQLSKRISEFFLGRGSEVNG